jgi:hypothetical protein
MLDWKLPQDTFITDVEEARKGVFDLENSESRT